MSEEMHLLEQCLTGDIQAFEGLIERYQTLICSIVYSATGNLTQSQDLAQETFIQAWNNRQKLRDPSKFRQWLCGIARNLISNDRRQTLRKPLQHPLDTDLEENAQTIPAIARDEAIRREEESILWRELQKIPDLYREPMILFYRQNRSIQDTANLLDLSEDTVKQRLARGRKLLHEQMAAFVEKTLERTHPAPNFSAVVIAAITQSASQITAVGIASSAAKTGWLAKGSALIYAIPILSWLVGAGIGGYFQLKWQSKTARSAREKRLILIAIITFAAICLVMNLFVLTIYQHAPYLSLDSILILIVSFLTCLAIVMHILGRWYNRKRNAIREEDGSPPLNQINLDEEGRCLVPRPIIVMGLMMSNAGGLLVPVLPFALLANDQAGWKIAGFLYSLITIPGILITLWFPHRHRSTSTFSTLCSSTTALIWIDIRWNVWINAVGMEGYLTPLSWWLLNLFLVGFIGYALVEWIQMKLVSSPKPNIENPPSNKSIND